MSLRVIACLLGTMGFSVYAWRNWFVSLCAGMVLMAFLEHPDMPKSIAGIQGFNLWNVLMANVLLAWWVERRREGRLWDIPRHMVALAAAYMFVLLWSFSRLAGDYGKLQELNDHHAARLATYSFTWITSEYLINCVKWVLPGMLLLDACRTRQRVMISLRFLLCLYVLLALQVIKHMPIGSVAMDGGTLARISAHILDHSVGYFRTELSMMFAGASWAVLSVASLSEKRWKQAALLGLAGVIALAQAETGGRAGYVTWGLTGLILCLVRWRKMLPLIPLTIVAVCLFLPAVSDRMLQGFGGGDGPIVSHENAEVITSGRVIAWSYVIPAIKQSLLFGYGRQAMVRTGIYEKIMEENNEGETFPHPHNAYLELLLDNGLLGFCLVIPFYVVMLTKSFKLLVDRSDPIFSAVGGVCCALMFGMLIAAMGAQSFYPRESAVGMWASMGIMLRVYLERQKALESGKSLFGEAEAEGEVAATEAEDSPFAGVHAST